MCINSRFRLLCSRIKRPFFKWSVQEILNICPTSYILNASSLFIMAVFSVQDSASYKRTGNTWHFTIRHRREKLISRLQNKLRILLKTFLATSILVFISCSTDYISFSHCPRYLNLVTCSILCPFACSWNGTAPSLQIHIDLVFDLFSNHISH